MKKLVEDLETINRIAKAIDDPYVSFKEGTLFIEDFNSTLNLLLDTNNDHFIKSLFYDWRKISDKTEITLPIEERVQYTDVAILADVTFVDSRKLELGKMKVKYTGNDAFFIRLHSYGDKIHELVLTHEQYEALRRFIE